MAAVHLKITREMPKKDRHHSPTRMEINDVDISSVVTSYQLTHHADGRVECVVTMVPGVIAAKISVENVRMDEKTQTALQALG
jgi:hypothetical protein